MTKGKRRPPAKKAADTNIAKSDPTTVRRRIKEMQGLRCECETSGWCWPCAELIKLRAELRGGAR